ESASGDGSLERRAGASAGNSTAAAAVAAQNQQQIATLTSEVKSIAGVVNRHTDLIRTLTQQQNRLHAEIARLQQSSLQAMQEIQRFDSILAAAMQPFEEEAPGAPSTIGGA